MIGRVLFRAFAPLLVGMVLIYGLEWFRRNIYDFPVWIAGALALILLVACCWYIEAEEERQSRG